MLRALEGEQSGLSLAQIAQALAKLGETVDLSVLKGFSAVFTGQVQGAHRLRAVSTVGDSFPLHCTASGKALLSVMPQDHLERFLREPLARLTPSTIVKASELRATIDSTRRTEIAFDDEEHTEDICAVGTAFLDPLGRSVAPR